MVVICHLARNYQLNLKGPKVVLEEKNKESQPQSFKA